MDEVSTGDQSVQPEQPETGGEAVGPAPVPDVPARPVQTAPDLPEPPVSTGVPRGTPVPENPGRVDPLQALARLVRVKALVDAAFTGQAQAGIDTGLLTLDTAAVYAALGAEPPSLPEVIVDEPTGSL